MLICYQHLPFWSQKCLNLSFVKEIKGGSSFAIHANMLFWVIINIIVTVFILFPYHTHCISPAHYSVIVRYINGSDIIKAVHSTLVVFLIQESLETIFEPLKYITFSEWQWETDPQKWSCFLKASVYQCRNKSPMLCK